MTSSTASQFCISAIASEDHVDVAVRLAGVLGGERGDAMGDGRGIAGDHAAAVHLLGRERGDQVLDQDHERAHLLAVLDAQVQERGDVGAIRLAQARDDGPGPGTILEGTGQAILSSPARIQT